MLLDRPMNGWWCSGVKFAAALIQKQYSHCQGIKHLGLPTCNWKEKSNASFLSGMSFITQSRASAQPQRCTQKCCPSSGETRVPGWWGTYRGECMSWGWGVGRLQTRWTGRDEECDYSYTPVFAPEDQMSYTKTARGSTWQERPEEATLSGVSLSGKAPWASCPSKREGQERWGHVS